MDYPQDTDVLEHGIVVPTGNSVSSFRVIATKIFRSIRDSR